MKELNNEDRLLIIEAIREYLEILEEWEDTNEKYIKELKDLLKRLWWIKELEDKLEKANKENEWQNKQDVATRVSEIDLQHKLDTIKRIADYE